MPLPSQSSIPKHDSTTEKKLYLSSFEINQKIKSGVITVCSKDFFKLLFYLSLKTLKVELKVTLLLFLPSLTMNIIPEALNQLATCWLI